MLTDARGLATGSTLLADVCVIGTGAAGTALALELTGSGLRTLVVESGGETGPDPATQALAAGESVGRPVQTLLGPVSLEQTRLRWLGGTTNHWAGFCRPLESVDFEVRDHLDVSGWPISERDLEPYWDRAAAFLRLSDSEFDPEVWATRVGLPPPLPPTASVHSVTFQITPFMRLGEVYGADLRTAEDVEVLLWANAVNLATTDGVDVDRIDLRTLDGTRLTVEARCYVLAAGGLENPRLLLASTDSHPTGIGNSHDQVGRYFTEHLQMSAGFGVIDVDPSEMAGYAGTDATITGGRFEGEQHGVKYALALAADHVREHQTLGLEAQLIVGRLPRGVPGQERGLDPVAISELLETTTGTRPATSIYLQVLAEQRLDAESRVTLGSSRDALGLPVTRLDWRYGPADRRAILDGLRTMAGDLGAAGLGRLQVVPGGVFFGSDAAVSDEFISIYGVDLDSVDEERFPIGVGFHHMCTTRMTRDPAKGVVDPDCRVHGVDNLYVAGSSVFATGGVATPTFTIVALAARLADHLKERLSPAAG